MREVNRGGKCNFWFHTRVPDVDLISLSPPGVGCHVTRGSNSFLWSVGAPAASAIAERFFLMKVKWGEKFVSENKMKSHAHYRTLAQPVKVKNVNSQLTDDFFKAKKALLISLITADSRLGIPLAVFLQVIKSVVCIFFFHFDTVIFANYYGHYFLRVIRFCPYWGTFIWLIFEKYQSIFEVVFMPKK